MPLGQKVRSLREELGMSQAELAASAELSQGYLSQLENEEVHNPSASVIFRLSEAIHVDPLLLMNAAGYAEGIEGKAGSEMKLDPDLLRFLSSLPRGQQAHLLRLLLAFEEGRTEDGGTEEGRIEEAEIHGRRRAASGQRGR